MYSIIPSIVDHASFIWGLLSQHYSEINTYFSKALYQVDADKLTKYVSHRLQEDNSVFWYFSLLDHEQVVWFVNTLSEPDYGEILVVLTAPEHTNQEAIDELINHAVAYLRSQWKTDIRFETYEQEALINTTLEQLWAKKYTSKRFL